MEPLPPRPGADDAPKKLSPMKWLGGALLTVAVTVVCGGLGIWFSGAHRGPSTPGVAPPLGATALAVVLFGAFGLFLIFLGGILFATILLTNAFTFRFDKPFLTSFKAKQWVGNLVVGLLVQSGFALMMAPVLMAVLLPRLPENVAYIVGFFGPFVVLNLIFTWLNLWPTLTQSLTTRRLLALGVPQEALAGAVHVGTSDPSKNSFKKLSLVEEDLGMLWLRPEGLSYRGDSTAWDVPRENISGIERKADAGAAAAYFGAVAVILCHTDPAGQPRQTRLHAQGGWTLSANARRQNDLGDKLASWLKSPPATLAPAAGAVAGAFPVTSPHVR